MIATCIHNLTSALVDRPAAPESPPPETRAFFSTTRREDFFDRFLSWIASLVS